MTATGSLHHDQPASKLQEQNATDGHDDQTDDKGQRECHA